jgi:cysteine protease ATG4
MSDDSDNSSSPSHKRSQRVRHVPPLSTARVASKHSSSPPMRIPSTPSTPLPASSSRPADVFDAPTPAPSPPALPQNGQGQSASPLSAQTAWYLDAYTDIQLKTFHSDKVRKMPLSGLDPSMLLGFLVKDGTDFDDFCKRASMVRPISA